DLDFNYLVVGRAIEWVGCRPSIEPLTDAAADFFHATRVKGDFCKNAAWRVRNILKLYRLLNIAIPEGRSPPDAEEDADADLEEAEEEECFTDDEVLDVGATASTDGLEGPALMPPPELPSAAPTPAEPRMLVSATLIETPSPPAAVPEPIPVTPVDPAVVPTPAELDRSRTSDSITTAATSTQVTPPPRHDSCASPDSTEKLPLPSSKKRMLLDVLVKEYACLEELLTLKRQRMAKQALEAARSVPHGHGDVDRFDTLPMDLGVAEQVLEAAKVECRKHEEEMQEPDAVAKQITAGEDAERSAEADKGSVDLSAVSPQQQMQAEPKAGADKKGKRPPGRPKSKPSPKAAGVEPAPKASAKAKGKAKAEACPAAKAKGKAKAEACPAAKAKGKAKAEACPAAKAAAKAKGKAKACAKPDERPADDGASHTMCKKRQPIPDETSDEARKRKSRQSCAYHKAKKQAEAEGMTTAEAKEKARIVSSLISCFPCFEKPSCACVHVFLLALAILEAYKSTA
ncbi:OGG1, partial [Symbiodinium necroappetens]